VLSANLTWDYFMFARYSPTNPGCLLLIRKQISLARLIFSLPMR
jgi:hypothetical protein